MEEKQRTLFKYKPNVLNRYSISFMEFFFARAALLSIEIVVAATKTTTGNIKHHIFMNSLQTLRIYHPYTVITHT